MLDMTLNLVEMKGGEDMITFQVYVAARKVGPLSVGEKLVGEYSIHESEVAGLGKYQLICLTGGEGKGQYFDTSSVDIPNRKMWGTFC